MKTVLVIEDNADILENTSEILELSNYRAVMAKNGKEGIAIAKQNKPDVILCDILMPEVNGFQVFEELKRNPATTGIPFIFVTASVEKKEVEAAMAMGVDGYLRKPFDSEELIKLIRSFTND